MGHFLVFVSVLAAPASLRLETRAWDLRAGSGGRTAAPEPAGPEVRRRDRLVLTPMAEAPGEELAGHSARGSRLPPLGVQFTWDGRPAHG